MKDSKQILQDVVNYIEESIRSSSKSSNIKYIDLKNQKSRIMTSQNHVIFGRRGAGKSSLLGVLGKDNNKRKGITIKINIEDFKDIPFPNIIIHILIKLYKSLDFKYENVGLFNFRRRSQINVRKKEIIGQIDQLLDLLKEPEQYQLTEKNRGKIYETGAAKAKYAGTSAEYTASHEEEQEKERTYQKDKLLDLRDSISRHKDILNEYCLLFNLDYIYLILDDFYFIPRNIQNKFIDYFHRLTKDTPLFLKVASIKFRSRLYAEENGTYIGTETNHDIIPIDLDYTLEDFNSLTNFMDSIITQIHERFNSESIKEYFAGDGFNQLCLASGGVPRDFLSLLAGLLNKVISGEITRIGKIEVTEMAISLISAKISSLKSDSNEEVTRLEAALQSIKHEILNLKRCNVFLICKDGIDKYIEEYDLLKQLMDLRLIHLVISNTSCAPSDGKRYEAYMIDIGLYANSRQQNFTQVDLAYRDEKSRNDQLRSSPKLHLGKLCESNSEQLSIML